MQRKSNLFLSEYPAGVFSQHRIVNFSHSHLAWVYLMEHNEDIKVKNDIIFEISSVVYIEFII